MDEPLGPSFGPLLSTLGSIYGQMTSCQRADEAKSHLSHLACPFHRFALVRQCGRKKGLTLRQGGHKSPKVNSPGHVCQPMDGHKQMLRCCKARLRLSDATGGHNWLCRFAAVVRSSYKALVSRESPSSYWWSQEILTFHTFSATCVALFGHIWITT